MSIQEAEALVGTIKDQTEELSSLREEYNRFMESAEHGEAAAEAIVSRSTEIDQACETVVGRQNELSESQGKAEALLGELHDLKDQAEAVRDDIKSSQAKAEELANRTAKTAAASEADLETTRAAKDARHREAEDFQQYVDRTKATLSELIEKAEAALSGSTSASLAEAYDLEVSKLRAAMRWWLLVISTFGAAAALLILHIVENTSLPQGDDLLPFLISGSSRWALTALIIGIVFFAIRQFRILRRDCQLYTHKATASRSFEGSRRELAAIEDGRYIGRFVDETITLFAMNSLGSPIAAERSRRVSDNDPTLATIRQNGSKEQEVERAGPDD
jgi:hypothetical protein